ncbi:MAG TPA: hypothetical protein VEI58_04560 [Chthoniobacterales bacterium]|nr:hypothetical protein [Chthoniobacterales bacterium]
MGIFARFERTSIKRTTIGLLVFAACFTQILAQNTSSLTDGELGRLADWVVQSGKQTFLNAPAAEAMGLGKFALPMHGLAFKPPGDDHVHIVLVGTSRGETDIVVTHTTLDQVGPMWLTSPTGTLKKTIYEDAKGIAVVTDGRFDADFQAQKAYLLSKIPAE